ncbi:signal peptidase I [Fastidiosibacter lacustris]|uniref:signal peptidase I n=1 Tax=Fastidiosibacter lacustris TaxID=2056695 RepID=UPI000E343D2C|nr:signal peptidase I [Fastidiosibacter lacustris]
MIRFEALYKGLITIVIFYVIYWILYTFHIGFIKQLTPSMPQGWYFTYPVIALDKGDNVVFMPNTQTEDYVVERGWLPTGVPFIKKVVGLPGDFLCIKDQSVYINEKWIASVYIKDDKGRSLPVFRYCAQIPKDQYFMQGVAHSHSFDSRYYGLVSRNQIVSKAIKL